MSSQPESQDGTDRGAVFRRVALTLVVLGSLAAVGVTLWRQSRSTADAQCQPEGGLRCAGKKAIEMCHDGALIAGIPCTGSCLDDGGVARCRTEAGALSAPVGAVCQAGMSVCSHDATTLLVCREGRLAVGAECPKGCVDEGDGLGLFCIDARSGIRFAEGFPCPGFKRSAGAGDGPEQACGADGEALLVCRDGLLVTDPARRCHPCLQSRLGTVTCAESAASSDVAAPNQ